MDGCSHLLVSFILGSETRAMMARESPSLSLHLEAPSLIEIQRYTFTLQHVFCTVKATGYNHWTKAQTDCCYAGPPSTHSPLPFLITSIYYFKIRRAKE